MVNRNTIGLIESSLETLSLAIKNLGISKNKEFIVETSRYSAEIGLIGASAEQLISACIIQAKGFDAIIHSGTSRYKTFRELIDDFKKMIKDHILARSVYSGIKEQDKHQEKLNEFASKFVLLCTARAGGLHGGSGLLHEATVVQAVQVSEFMDLLSKSDDFNPYMRFIPRCSLYKINRTFILEDLASKFSQANEEDKPALLTSIYLVLPEIPKNAPDWLESFEKVSIAPAKDDVIYLTEVLGGAYPATFIRSSSMKGDCIPVTFKHDDPDAIQVSSFYLKRKHSELREQWYADIGNANGRLDNGVLHKIPNVTVAEVFALGLDGADIMTDEYFGAHESWPFIVSSMNIQGTCGPYWFLVKKTKDLPQLKRQLCNVKKLVSPETIKKIDECISGIDLLLGNNNNKNATLYELKGSIYNSIKKRSSIKECIERSKRDNIRVLPDTLEKKLLSCLQDKKPYVDIYDSLLHEDYKEDVNIKYWFRILAEGSLYFSEAAPLVSILENTDFRSAHTAVKKALRMIDFIEFGPDLP